MANSPGAFGMTHPLKDIWYALCMLMRNPGFGVVAVADVLTMVARRHCIGLGRRCCVDAPDVEGVVSGQRFQSVRKFSWVR
jgi:hypothetical protein